MLLETLDLLKNDVIIYSENKFDLQRNFKIIFKRSEIKTPKRIDFFEVCNFINEPVPKNLIVYRLLTNTNDFDAFSTKYGFFIKSDSGLELIYFDPIFALNDLSNFQLKIDPNLFRFKIQQVGFTSMPSRNNEAYYGEVYAFDLRSDEAKNQNDKIFAKAIFALDDSFIDDEEDITFIAQSNFRQNVFEDNSTKKNQFIKPIVNSSRSVIELNDIKLQSLNSLKNISDNSDRVERFNIEKSKFIKKKSFRDLINKTSAGEENQKSILGNAAEEYKNRKEVILKFRKGY